MINFPIKLTFWLLIAVFVLNMLGMFVPSIGTILFQTGWLFAVFGLWILFFVLGAILIFPVFKNKITGKLKVSLLLTGFAAIGFFVFAVLHNLVSGALSIIFKTEIEEPVFFILATMISPLTFLFGAIKSIILFNKK